MIGRIFKHFIAVKNICFSIHVYEMEYTSRTSVGVQPSGRRQPGLEGQAVALDVLRFLN